MLSLCMYVMYVCMIPIRIPLQKPKMSASTLLMKQIWICSEITSWLWVTLNVFSETFWLK